MFFLTGATSPVYFCIVNLKLYTMKKVTQLVLMLCLVLSGALCYARGNARTEMKKEGTPIDVIAKAIHGEYE